MMMVVDKKSGISIIATDAMKVKGGHATKRLLFLQTHSTVGGVDRQDRTCVSIAFGQSGFMSQALINNTSTSITGMDKYEQIL